MKRCALFLFLTAVLLAQSAPEVEITAEPHHHQVLANDQVRVFNVEVAPHSDTLMHWHRHDYIYVTLGATEVVNAVKGKAPIAVKLADGDTRFLPASFAHVARNPGDHPFRNVTIELLQDEKLRQSAAKRDPAHSEENRGLDILEGGTKEILFVKDNVRVSEFELQPNAVVPGGAHAHPMLLVALTDSDLFTQDPRTHDSYTSVPSPTHFKTGDSTWLPLGFHQPIVNASPHTAKFVTLEFP
jgi:quercetin dioxygenase-like cupin family protein